MPFLTPHWQTEGPLGLPMLDKQAQQLDALLKGLPQDDLHAPGKLTIEKATTELLPGERADVSWISTEDIDRYKDVVRAAGMDDSHFRLNPVVTLQHAYWLPPVGRSLWRKKVKDGDRLGIKAKTVYPTRPAWLAQTEVVLARWHAPGRCAPIPCKNRHSVHRGACHSPRTSRAGAGGGGESGSRRHMIPACATIPPSMSSPSCPVRGPSSPSIAA